MPSDMNGRSAEERRQALLGAGWTEELIQEYERNLAFNWVFTMYAQIKSAEDTAT